MIATYESEKHQSNQTADLIDTCRAFQYPKVGVSVLLIGDDDVVIKTSGLIWDTLPRFGEVRVVKLVPLSAVPFVDPKNFQLLFFHLSHSNTAAEPEALHDLREKSRKHSDQAVCVLVVPEGGPDVPDSAADFVLTQPVTVEAVEEVFRWCSFLSEQSQNDSPSSASSDSAVGRKPEPEAPNHQAEPEAPNHQAEPEAPNHQAEPEAPNHQAEPEAPNHQAEPEAPNHQAEPATPVQGRTFNLHPTRRPQRRRAEGVATPSGPLPEGPGPEQSSGVLRALLHSKKEQQRRMQIRRCCERLRELLPFSRSRTDTASTLELTVKYMVYLRQRLPQHILDTVVEALEESEPERWYKPTKAPKKRTACPVGNKPADVPTGANFADDFIAAHVLGTCIQPKLKGIHPTGSLPPDVLMSQPFSLPPGLSPASGPSVAPGQASGPFGQTFVMNQAYGEQAAIKSGYAPPLFWKLACGPVSSVAANQNFVPQMVHSPAMTRALTVEESSRPPVQTLMVGPEFLPRAGLEPGYRPPPRRVMMMMMNPTFAPRGSLNDPCPPEVASNQRPACAAASGGVSDRGPITTAGSWEDRLLNEMLYGSSHSSSPSTVRVDNLPQGSAPKPPSSSSSLFRPPQWDFGCERGPGYPLQPYFLDSLAPPSVTHRVPAQNAPVPGSGNQFLGDLGTNKLYGQHRTGPTYYQIN